MNIKKAYAPGDVYIFPIELIPTNAKEVVPNENILIFAHSETGHHHTIDVDVMERQPNVRLYADAKNPLIGWLEVNRPATLKHMRSFDTHAPITLPPGNYEIRRQREYTPEGWRRVQD